MMKRYILILLLMLITLISAPITTTKATPTPTHKLKYTKLRQIDPLISDGSIASPVWISWSPDGKLMAVIYEYLPSIRILDASTGSFNFSIDTPRLIEMGRFALAWSADGQYLLGSFDFSDEDGNYGEIRIWKLAKNAAHIVTSFQRPINCPIPLSSWHVDRKKIMTVCWSEENQRNILLMWDVSKGISVKEYDNRYNGTWSPNGKIIITSIHRDYKNAKLYLADGDTLAPLFEFPDVDEIYWPTLIVSWSADSHYVAGVSCRGSTVVHCKIWVWNAETGQVKDDFQQGEEFLSRIRFNTFSINPSGTLVSVAEWNKIYFWDTKTGKLFEPLQIMELGGDTDGGSIGAVTWQPNQNVIAVASGDGSIQIWQIDYME